MLDWFPAYTTLKFLHILLAVVAVGANTTYGIWIGRSSRTPEILPGVLRTIKFIDDRVANPCYGLLLVTGIGLVWVGGWSLRTPWILAGLVLYAVMLVLGLGWFTPALRRQIEALDRFGFMSDSYRKHAARARAAGIAAAVPAVLILAMMVLKPG